jgi:NADH dehydrogenase
MVYGGAMSRADVPHVVIVGGGFAGLWCTRALASAPVRVTLLDRANHPLFQPLLYQVATAGLSAGDIAAPLRLILRRQRNVTVRLGEAVGIDTGAQTVSLADGNMLRCDFLLVCSGATHAYFGHDEWAPFAPGLKTLDDAMTLRRRILLAFEQAENASSDGEREAWLTFAVVGGGPTGVELAGSMAEIARHTLRDEFRHIDPACAQVQLIDMPGGLRFSGLVAWWFWLAAHVFFLIGFRNRIVVLMNWAWACFTCQRHARIVFGSQSAPMRDNPSSNEAPAA